MWSFSLKISYCPVLPFLLEMMHRLREGTKWENDVGPVTQPQATTGLTWHKHWASGTVDPLTQAATGWLWVGSERSAESLDERSSPGCAGRSGTREISATQNGGQFKTDVYFWNLHWNIFETVGSKSASKKRRGTEFGLTWLLQIKKTTKESRQRRVKSLSRDSVSKARFEPG